MKILWITNILFPYPLKQLNMPPMVVGGWLYSLLSILQQQEEFEFAVASIYPGKELMEMEDNGVKYYLIPGKQPLKYEKTMEQYWKQINEKFSPDLVHIHGTEYTHGLAFVNACPEVKTVTSIQGLISEIEKVYYANIPLKEIVKNITLRDIIKFDNLIDQKRRYHKRSQYEKGLIQKTDAIIGRTTWDYANTKRMCLQEKYYSCNEILRDSFYDNQWNIEKIERHTIFCCQGTYPIKGLHYMIEALYSLKNYYADAKLYVAGSNITDISDRYHKLKQTGYAKYLRKLIEKYQLKDSIIFTGSLSEEEMLQRLLKTNVFVLPSAIENSSNSLSEAMILGLPCIASNTGGTMDMLEYPKEGLLYPYTEPAILAEYVMQYFRDDDLCIKLGQAARTRALERHNKQAIGEKMIQIYKEMNDHK